MVIYNRELFYYRKKHELRLLFAILIYAFLLNYKIKTGNNLFSQQGNPQVSSAHWSLTSVFGMGTGITSM